MAKAAPEVTGPPWKPRPGTEWRVRPTGPTLAGPSTWPRPARLAPDDFTAELIADDWRAEGQPCVVEQAVPYGYRVATPPPLTMKQLAAEGLAQQRPGNVWIIEPEGLRRLAVHARVR